MRNAHKNFMINDQFGILICLCRHDALSNTLAYFFSCLKISKLKNQILEFLARNSFSNAIATDYSKILKPSFYSAF